MLTEEVVNNLRFPGQYFDSETGLHYNWNRYYDPSTGRYITADPIGLDGGMNLYAYVQNDPVNAVDPKGLHGPKPGQLSGIPVGYCHQEGHNQSHPGQTSELEFGKGTVGASSFQFTCCNGGKVVNVKGKKVCRGLILSGISYEPRNAGVTSKSCDGLKAGDIYFGAEAAVDYGLGLDLGISFPCSGVSGTASIEFGSPGAKIVGCTYFVESVMPTGDCCGDK